MYIYTYDIISHSQFTQDTHTGHLTQTHSSTKTRRSRDRKKHEKFDKKMQQSAVHIYMNSDLNKVHYASITSWQLKFIRSSSPKTARTRKGGGREQCTPT